MSEALYQSLIVARSRVPLHAGRPEAVDAHGAGENRMCGDSVGMFFRQADRSWRHEAQGCAILTASADLLCEAFSGKDIAEIRPLGAQFETLVKTGETNPALGDLNALASIAQYPARLRCATLPWNAVSNALASLSTGGCEHV